VYLSGIRNPADGILPFARRKPRPSADDLPETPMKALPAVPALAAALLLSASAALAQAPFLYSEFEAAVPHLDLETCPEGLAEGPVFCRVTLGHDSVHVFAFSEEGDQPFVAMRTYYEDEFTLTVGD
jgi:hypothetical protein